MYIKRIRIRYYGPINHLDITLPFSEENPKPVVLVGENGSGKSILLSHVINALMSAQSYIYENPEVETGKVYKLRTPRYIKYGEKYSFGRVDFENDLHNQEMILTRLKKDYDLKPDELQTDCERKHYQTISNNDNSKISNNFSKQDLPKFR